MGGIVGIAVLNGVGVAFNWYRTIWWFDIPMHLLGGGWLVVLFFYLRTTRFAHVALDSAPCLRFLSALGFVALVGVGWEFFEYGLEFVLPSHLPAAARLADTFGDLLNDLLGGVAVYYLLTAVRFFRR
ncbi:hypothetical protein D6833_07570 [Candidatus Parcubacteria bacterium]|nr:MAG: hypothetical protein D6833_07570 [Candidatus Parcubacteria bacterium]